MGLKMMVNCVFSVLAHLLQMILGYVINSKCAVPENIHTHPMEGCQKLLGGGGLKSQNFSSKVL